MANSVSQADLAFGLSFMSQLGDGNAITSPYSIRTALGILYEGATGETAKQIAQVTGLPEDSSVRHTGFRTLMDALNQAGSYTLRSANGVWVAQRFPLNPDFRGTLLSQYRAQCESADFEGNAEGCRKRINDWVDKVTERKIPELFPPGSFNHLTVIALAEALYFKGPWDNKFDPDYTRKQDFRLSSGQTVSVDMMRKGEVEINASKPTLPKFYYGELEGTQIVSLPYKDHELTKIVMLPPKGERIQRLMEFLKERAGIMEPVYRTREREFERLELPKHELRSKYENLVGLLSNMGITRIFSEDTAELSGIGPGPLFVNSGVHEALFKTNEEGSEGVAATGFGVSKSVSHEEEKPVEFIADRPFLEAVVHERSGAVLFLNRIEDPR